MSAAMNAENVGAAMKIEDMNAKKTGQDSLQQVPLYRLAHSRSGDKGDISNISVIAWDAECHEYIEAQVTEASVAAWFAYRKPRSVRRYVLPELHAMNFVLDGVLDGGVNDALNMDAHGKGLSFWLLDMPVQVPRSLAARLPDVPSAHAS
jgi:hypothetical protein